VAGAARSSSVVGILNLIFIITISSGRQGLLWFD
jgi:hypothetical protein